MSPLTLEDDLGARLCKRCKTIKPFSSFKTGMRGRRLTNASKWCFDCRASLSEQWVKYNAARRVLVAPPSALQALVNLAIQTGMAKERALRGPTKQRWAIWQRLKHKVNQMVKGMSES